MKNEQHGNFEEQEHIEELVLRYQDGDEEAGIELLSCYGGSPYQKGMTSYLGKFYKIIRYGKFDFKDYDSRAFIACFFSSSKQNAILNSYQYKKTKQEILRKIQQISEAMSVYDDEDLMQELRIMFLHRASLYVKMNRTFGAYLSHSYRYAVFNFIVKAMKTEDPYIKMPKDIIRVGEEDIEDVNAKVDANDSIFKRVPMMVMDDALGNSWVRGLTCGDEFKGLTPLQRLILKLNYFDGWSDARIADQLGVHINTVFRHRAKANKIVKQTVALLKEEGESDE